MTSASDPMHARVSFLILTLLAIKPSHGYELLKTIEKITMGTLKPGPGTVYPLLRSLKEQGLVEEETVVEGGRARRVYRLTRRGWEELRAQLEVFKAVTLNILNLVEAAWSAIPRSIREGESCPSEDFVSRLEALRDAVNVYIERVREALNSCKSRRLADNGG